MELLTSFVDRMADAGSSFDLRLEELGADLIRQDGLSLLKELLNVGAKLTRAGIDDLVFLFDADGERRRGHMDDLRAPGKIVRHPGNGSEKPK